MKIFKFLLLIMLILIGSFCFIEAYKLTREIMIWEINPDSYLDVHMNMVQ